MSASWSSRFPQMKTAPDQALHRSNLFTATAEDVWGSGADVLLLTSASPGRGLENEPKLRSARWVEHINQAYASLFTTFVAHANRSGFEDGLNYWGGSTVYNPDGDLLVQAPYHEEALVMTEIDMNQLRRTRTRLPLLRDERTSLVQRELERILDPRA